MGRIQTNIGLITGMDIGKTVSSLMEIASKPRDMLQGRIDAFKEEQAAVAELAAYLLNVQYITDSLGKTDLYAQRAAVSSNSSALSVTVTGSPAEGSYQYTPIRVAQNQHLLSSGLKSKTQPIGEGTLTFRFGDHVQRSSSLDLFGGGEGVKRGRIRITDRAGQSAEIDLTTVQTVDDVLEAINANTTINVTAVAVGDRIRLVDNTGQTVSNLKVQEVGGGTTAASLGLDGIDEAATTADGRDMLWLTRDLELDVLNDGKGVHRDTALPDIEYTLRDGTHGYIDLSPIASGTAQEDVETTLGELLDRINAKEPGKLKVEIAPDGDRLVLTDLTEGEGSFVVESAFGSDALADLGLDGAAVGGTITGRRILGGARTVLLCSLGGGSGLGQLGALDLTDRNGANDSVDLAGVETLDDVIERINASSVGIAARVNDARNGILLTDTTGSSAGNLVVTSGDATDTAAKLQIAVDAQTEEVDSGDLHLQTVSYNTRLADLNGGAGISKGKIAITDSSGYRDSVDLRTGNYDTVEDVIQAINRMGVDVRARINDTGDGILVEDLAHGSGTLKIADDGSGTAAKDLHLTGSAKTVEIDGQSTQVIDGSTTYMIKLDGSTSLEGLASQINALGAGVQAAVLTDGSNKPYRLSLTSQRAGQAGSLVVDASQLGFSMDETSRGQDALLALGQVTGGSAVLVSSATNRFTDVLPGMTLEVKQASTSPVTVSVQTSDTNLVANVQSMVDNYNKLRSRLSELTAYDPETDTSAVLTGDSTALRLESELSYLLSGRFSGAGLIQSLGELGVTFKDDGTLEFDDTKLRDRYAADPDAVKSFFTTSETGFSAKFKALSEQLSGQNASMLTYRYEALGTKIDRNEKKIEEMTARLDVQQQRLYTQFYNMEVAIGKLQSNLSVLDAIQPIQPRVASGNSN